MKTRPVLLFLVTFTSIFLILSLWTYIKVKRTEEFSTTFENFQSDFDEPGDKDALIGEIISRKKRFFAYGTYIQIPAGEFVVTFDLTSSSSEPASFQLQVAADRGKSVILSQDVQQSNFPVIKDLPFKIAAEREIEPRILYSSGSQDIILRQVKIRKIKGIFPWTKNLSAAILYAIGCTLILLSIVSTSWEPTKWKYYIAGFLFLAGCFLIFRKAWLSEDAFITLRHVDNFIKGYGPVFNVSERVEGFTHPLWFALLSIFRWLGFSPKGAAVLPALMASFAALYFLFFRIRIRDENGSSSFLNPAAAILIGSSAFIDFGTSGLETGLSYLLLVLYAKFLLENRWLKQPVLTGFIASLLILNRPDFGIFLVLLIIVYAFEVVKKNIQKKHLVRFLAFPILFVGGYQIFRMGYYAALLPNPFYTKSGAGAYWSQGSKYLMDLFQGSLVPVILVVTIPMFFLERNKGHLKNRLIILFSGLLHGFFVIRGGGDFMHGRFLLPAFILITLSQTGAFDHLLNKKPSLRIGGIALCLILLFSSLSVIPVQKRGQPLHNNITDERFFYYKDDIIPFKHLLTDTMIMIWKNIGINYRNLAERTQMPIRIAYKNVGFTGFYSGPKVYVCDELGLNDPVVSRVMLKQRKRPGHEKNAPFGYLIMRKLTFRKTHFPLWNQLANTRFGILWDLSPRTLRKFHFMLDENFKQELDGQVIGYLRGLEETELSRQADFLFFLKNFWFPYAAKDHQQVFLLKYKQDNIAQYSNSFRWIEENREKVDSHLMHLQGQIDAKKFLANIGYALKNGLTLKYSPIGPAEE